MHHCFIFYIPLPGYFYASWLNCLHHIASVLRCCCLSAFRQRNFLLSFFIITAPPWFAVIIAGERIYASINHILLQKRTIVWHAASM